MHEHLIVKFFEPLMAEINDIYIAKMDNNQSLISSTHYIIIIILMDHWSGRKYTIILHEQTESVC